MPYVVYPSASSSLNNYTQRFTSSTTWVAPTGCKLIDLVCVGGGGGGGYAWGNTSAYNMGGGGAGGEVVRRQLAVTAGQSYQIIVGAGGAGGVNNSVQASATAAQNGGHSAFNFSYTSENIIYNGAAESTTNNTIIGAAHQFSTMGTFPSYPTGYTANAPSTSSAGRQAISALSLPAISGITHCWLVQNSTSLLLNGSTDHVIMAAWIPITGSTQYTYSGYVIPVNANSNGPVNIRVDYYTSYGSGLISGTQGTQSNMSGTSAWSRRTLTDTSPSNATWALLRIGGWYQNASNSGNFAFTGLQAEQAGSVSDYVGLNSSNVRYTNAFGFVSNIAGVFAEGGGGGQSNHTQNPIAGIGFGGGNTATSTSAWCFAGNGTGAGGAIGIPFIQSSTINAAAISAVRGVDNALNGYFSSGGVAVTFNVSDAPNGHAPHGAPATFDGFGAGGMGGVRAFARGMNGYGTAPALNADGAGGNALANTGAGGGGAFSATNAVGYNGGNGGSGIVLISYLAE